MAVSRPLWADVERRPASLRHVGRVAPIDARTFAWRLSLPGVDEVFVAELTEVVPEERIARRTTEGARHAGVVTFHRPSDTESRVTLRVEYEPKGFVEHSGALTNLDATLAHYDLGGFRRTAEHEAGHR
ncbi:SRPBCC family protein [Streptomyces cinereoruber]|uniref:SRPBCC family protein n=1 Tax=Streptomyces cinereoruber TaxID=67260 RepID=UPI003C2BFDC7